MDRSIVLTPLMFQSQDVFEMFAVPKLYAAVCSGVNLWSWERCRRSFISRRFWSENMQILSKTSVSIHFVQVQVIRSLKSNLCSAAPDIMQQKITSRYHKINSPSYGMTLLHENVFVTGIRRLLVINRWRSGFPLRNHYKCQRRSSEKSILVTLVPYSVK